MTKVQTRNSGFWSDHSDKCAAIIDQIICDEIKALHSKIYMNGLAGRFAEHGLNFILDLLSTPSKNQSKQVGLALFKTFLAKQKTMFNFISKLQGAKARTQRKLTRFKRGSIIVWLTSCLTSLDWTKEVNLLLIQLKQSSWSQTSKTG